MYIVVVRKDLLQYLTKYVEAATHRLILVLLIRIIHKDEKVGMANMMMMMMLLLTYFEAFVNEPELWHGSV